MRDLRSVLADRNKLVKGSMIAGLATVIGMAGVVGVNATTGGAGYGYGYGAGYGTQTPVATTIYRAANPRNGDHFYTTDLSEKTNAVSAYRYNDEGVAFTALSGTNSGVSPVYRLVSKRTGDHFYTADFTEAMNASNFGYVNEGIAFSAWKGANDAAERGP